MRPAALVLRATHGILRAVLPPITVNDTTLDPDLRAFLALIRRKKPLEVLSPTEARHTQILLRKLFPTEPVELHSVEDFEAAGLPMRRYRPTPETPRSGLLYFHGGGFVIGNLESHDHACRVLAREAQCEVVSVDYRLAPEHPFPAAVEDALTAWRWFRNEPYARHLVGGDSAGGNLSIVICQQAEQKPDAQLLVYPATDRATRRPSRTTFAEGFYYSDATSQWFMNHYIPDGTDRTDERISPNFRTDLADQPPAHVVHAGFDILSDEVRLYADRLTAAGVPVTVQEEPTLVHGFMGLAGICSAAAAALERTGRGLREL